MRFLSTRQLLLQPRLLPYFALTLASYGAVQLYFTYFNVWLVERLAWDPVQLAQAAVLVSVPMMLGSWIGEQLARHWRGSSLGIVGHLVMAAGMLMFILPTQWWGLALTFIPAGIGMQSGGAGHLGGGLQPQPCQPAGAGDGALPRSGGGQRDPGGGAGQPGAAGGDRVALLPGRPLRRDSVPSVSTDCADGRTGETPWPGAPRRADEGRGDLQFGDGMAGRTCIAAPSLGRYGSLSAVPAPASASPIMGLAMPSPHSRR